MPATVTGMDARSARFGPWLGGAILLGLVALMVVVASVRGTVVAGSPVAAPVPGPPEPGHCLLEDPLDGDSSGFVMYSDDDELPDWRTGRCAGARYGEVVTIGAGIDLASSFQVGTWERCWRDAMKYLGLPEPAADDGHPVPDISVMTALIGPDPRQRASGQDWAACVALPASSDSGSAVEHPLRDAWNRTDGRRLLALCQNDSHLLFQVDCGDRHGAERVSSWSGDPVKTGVADDETCRAEAADALGSPAALDRGDLSAVVLPTRWDDPTGQQITGPDAVSAVEPYIVICVLVPADPARMLVGPLRGLGDSPVPLG